MYLQNINSQDESIPQVYIEFTCFVCEEAKARNVYFLQMYIVRTVFRNKSVSKSPGLTKVQSYSYLPK